MKKLPVFIIGLMASLAIGISTARAQVYSLEDLGVVKGMEYSQAAAINNLGNVAGTAYKGLGTCAFHYSNKFMADAGGLNSRGFDISSANLVVGDNFFMTGPQLVSHAALFKGGIPMDLGVLKGQLFSRANGINAIGQVVGFSGRQRDSEKSRAFAWTSEIGMFDIGTLGGAYAQAYAINDAGFVTGASQTQGMGPMLTTHAFIYRLPTPPYFRYNQMGDLGVLGGISSYGTAINDNNHVAGYSTITANDDRVHAFLHNGKSMIDLGSLGWKGTETDVSVALGLNRWDQVVGYSYLPGVGDMPLQQVAFLWSKGKMINLNKVLMLTAQGQYLLTSAVGINDRGQIVANAYHIQNGTAHAVLLTPMGPATH